MSSSLPTGVDLVGVVLARLMIVLVVATVTAAYRQPIVTVMIFSRRFTVNGSSIGRENTRHTMEMSFSNNWKLKFRKKIVMSYVKSDT